MSGDRLERAWAALIARTDYERCERPRVPRFGLDSIRGLMERLGRPQADAPVIHVAGSKGKGSTCHFLERGLRAAGLRTGLYTSPHLESWRERIRVDGQPAPDEALAAAFEDVLAVSDGEETFFDLMTAAALVCFRSLECEAWLIEVGLGGRFDSTNVVQPLAALVTAIEREHTEVLGNDLLQIAREKAGIFKPGARLWSGLPREHLACDLMRAQAEECGSELLELPVGYDVRPDLPHPQPHMRANFALAQAVLRDLGPRRPRFASGAAALDTLPAHELAIPGRFEARRDAQGRTVIFDVAHTPASLAAVLQAFRASYSDRRRGVVFAARSERDPGELACALGPPPADEIWWTAPAGDHPQSADPHALARAFEARVLEEPELPSGPEVLLVTGSTYLVGCLRPETRGLSSSTAESRSTQAR